MNLTIRGNNILVTNALKEYAERKILKLKNFFESDFTSLVTVNLKVQKHERIVEVTIPFSSLLLRAEVSHPDMYTAIDQVVEKLVKQIQKYKTKTNRLQRENKQLLDYSIDETQLESGDEPFEVVRQKHFNVKPMFVEEAILQMDMLGHNFFIFSDHDAGNTNVVYKRNDGKYGLIMPE